MPFSLLGVCRGSMLFYGTSLTPFIASIIVEDAFGVFWQAPISTWCPCSIFTIKIWKAPARLWFGTDMDGLTKITLTGLEFEWCLLVLCHVYGHSICFSHAALLVDHNSHAKVCDICHRWISVLGKHPSQGRVIRCLFGRIIIIVCVVCSMVSV